MESMEIPLHATVAIAGAVLAAAYILFGSPLSTHPTPKKKKQKKGSIPGLENIGNSCFLNSILQAVATSPSFVQWLDDQDLNYDLILLRELRKMTKVLNNNSEDFPNTRAVLSALRSHGWVISREEQDAHELFHVLTSTLDDEFKASSQVSNSLFNLSWLEDIENKSIDADRVLTIDEMGANSECVFANNQWNHATKTSENTLPEKEPAGSNIKDQYCNENNISLVEFKNEHANFINSDNLEKYLNKSSNEVSNNSEDNVNKKEIGSFCKSSEILQDDDEISDGLEVKDFKFASRENLPSLMTRVGSPVLQLKNNSVRQGKQESPFKGYLANRLQCMQCGFKNPEQWSSFESISLALPPHNLGFNHISHPVKLNELLHAYISPECVTEVTCDGCSGTKGENVKSNFSKQLTIGKLPSCLCIHIQRTTWLENGCPVKRTDHVAIPDILDMTFYTYSFSYKKQNIEQNGLFGGCEEKRLVDVEMNCPLLNFSSQIKDKKSFQPNKLNQLVERFGSPSKNLYKLRAVIVHIGDVFKGHFATYRRGPYNSALGERWFYTSDLVVREVWPEEVFQASVYMALYERI